MPSSQKKMEEACWRCGSDGALMSRDVRRLFGGLASGLGIRPRGLILFAPKSDEMYGHALALGIYGVKWGAWGGVDMSGILMAVSGLSGWHCKDSRPGLAKERV